MSGNRIADEIYGRITDSDTLFKEVLNKIWPPVKASGERIVAEIRLKILGTIRTDVYDNICTAARLRAREVDNDDT